MASPDDNILEGGTVGQSVGGTPLGLIYQELKIISLLLQEGFNIRFAEDKTFLSQGNPNPSTGNPTNI